MEMRRIFAAVAVLVSLAAAAQAGLQEYHFPIGDHNSVKVDGSKSVRWPTDFEDLTICAIPVKMNLGMYVEIDWPIDTGPVDFNDFNDFVIEPEPNDVEVDRIPNWKIELQQVLCSDIGRDDSDWPCYLDCIDLKVRANYQVILGTELVKTGDVIDKWQAYFDGTNIVTGSGDYQKVRVCVKAWKANLSDAQAGENEVGKLLITVVPDMTAPIFIFE